MVNKIIETTSTDYMNITDINLMQFAGVLLITNKETPAKPTTNRNQEMDHHHGSTDSRNK